MNIVQIHIVTERVALVVVALRIGRRMLVVLVATMMMALVGVIMARVVSAASHCLMVICVGLNFIVQVVAAAAVYRISAILVQH